MRLPRMTRGRSIEFNVTPLIDVVFLLIVFFLVSSHLAQQETQLELDLPTAVAVQPPTAGGRPRVTINLLADGQILMGSSTARPDELQRRLVVEQQRTQGNLEVRIRGDRTVPYGVVEPILLACAEAGIWSVSFAVREKQMTP